MSTKQELEKELEEIENQISQAYKKKDHLRVFVLQNDLTRCFTAYGRLSFEEYKYKRHKIERHKEEDV